MSSRISATNSIITNNKDKSAFETITKLHNVVSKEEMTISKVHAADESGANNQLQHVVLVTPIPS